MDIWGFIKGLFTPTCKFCGSKNNVKAYDIEGVLFFACNKLVCKRKIKQLELLCKSKKK